jgi:nucleotide-binding universal stress UspA family protein
MQRLPGSTIGYESGMTQVLIAVDDSESSVKTARAAYALFGDTASYIVVNVADHSPVVWGGAAYMWGIGYPIMMSPAGIVGPATERTGAATEPHVKGESASIDGAIQVALDVATEAHLPDPQVVGEVGDPALAIIAAAHHHGADVIVVGSHDRSWFGRLFEPSVAGAVLKDADIPVLVAR